MSFVRKGCFEITRLQEVVDDHENALCRAKTRLAPLKEFAARLDAAAEAFYAEAKAAVEALPKSVGQEIVDKELRRVTEAVSSIENLLCEVGLDAYRETEAEAIGPLERDLQAAEQALEVAEREQADRDYWRSVA